MTKETYKNSLSVFRWILRSLFAHNFSRLTQLKAYFAEKVYICVNLHTFGTFVALNLNI